MRFWETRAKIHVEPWRASDKECERLERHIMILAETEMLILIIQETHAKYVNIYIDS